MGGARRFGQSLTPLSRERGAALVEMALIAPLLLMLLLGVVTAGLAYHQNNSLQTASREGVRFGATLPMNDVNLWLGEVRDVTKAAATGDLETGVPGQFICVAILGPTEGRLVESGSGPPGLPGCFDDQRPDSEARVQVVTRRTATINALVFTTDVTLESASVARFER